MSHANNSTILLHYLQNLNKVYTAEGPLQGNVILKDIAQNASD